MSNEPIKVLLVEDDPAQALLTTRVLQHALDQHIEIEHVSRLAEAESKIEEQAFEAILLDLNLPDSEGIDTVLRVRNQVTNQAVVVLTGLDDVHAGIQAIECGAQDFVVKGMISGGLLIRSLQFAIARQKQILHYRMEANTDALTGLANRRALTEQLKHRHNCLAASGDPYSLLILDIDHFKSINDQYGHRTGDFALSSLAGPLVASLNESDFVARYGGEEFAVVFQPSNQTQAERIAKRLLSEIRELEIEFEGATFQMTVSIGFTKALQDESIDDVIQRADQALYAAKKERDRACCLDGGEPNYITSSEHDAAYA